MHIFEKAGASDEAKASLIMPAHYREKMNVPRFKLDAICFDKFGQIRWEDTIANLVTTQGKNHIIDTYFNGSAYTATWFVALIDNAGSPTVVVGDTYASHAYTELTAYSQGTRPALSLGAASAGSATTSTIVFSPNATNTVNGVSVVNNSTKGDTAAGGGRLYSGGVFAAGARAVLSGDTLNVTLTFTG